MEIDEVKTIIKNVESIEDLAKCGPINEPSLFSRNKNLVRNIGREFTNKAAEFLKRKIKNIEVCYDAEGTGFDVFIYLDEKKCRLTSVGWDSYSKLDMAPKSCFSVNARRFYETQTKVYEILNKLGYRCFSIGGD